MIKHAFHNRAYGWELRKISSLLASIQSLICTVELNSPDVIMLARACMPFIDATRPMELQVCRRI